MTTEATLPDVSHSIDVAQVAQICYAANAAYARTIGEGETKAWSVLDQADRDSYMNGVLYRINHLHASPEDQHNEWARAKQLEGWVHGDVKDVEKKTHPCLVPYYQLPVSQRVKDSLFVAIVKTLANAN